MEKLTGFYFSGTGNTKFIAEYFIKQLSAEYDCTLLDISSPFHLQKELGECSLLLFAYPIYGSAPPIPMRKFVHRCGKLLNGKKVIILQTQYFFSGDGPATLGRTVQKYGGKIIGAEMFNMPNNLSDCTIFPVKNGEEISGTLERAQKKAKKLARRITLRGRAKKRGFSLLSHVVGFFSQRVFWMKGEVNKRNKLKIDERSCVGCGLCVQNCPAGNLFISDKKAKPLSKCVLCYRCVNLCPKKAITLIGSAPPKVQYKGPRQS